MGNSAVFGNISALKSADKLSEVVLGSVWWVLSSHPHHHREQQQEHNNHLSHNHKLQSLR